MKLREGKENSSTSVILERMKKISLNIMRKIQNSIGGFRDKIMADIKGKDSIITVFLKISSLLCKLIIIESKIDDKKIQTNFNDTDIQLIKDFLSNYNQDKEGVENEE
ncbi:MAG: Phage protein [Candidatus Midichloria mitochondrii]